MSANPLEGLLCDGCRSVSATSPADVPATTPFVLGEKLWGLCDAHAEKLDGWFTQAFQPAATTPNTVAA